MKESKTGDVFPACAGMIRAMYEELKQLGGVPRVRGDDPKDAVRWLDTTLCSPRARG